MRDGKWYDLTGQSFGAATGFPMADATSKFRVKFKSGKAGEYNFNAFMNTAVGSEELCKLNVAFTVSSKWPAPTNIRHTDCTVIANNNGTITGVETSMEYQKSGASSWTACTGTTITGLANGTYLVRVKATDTVLASDSVTVTIAAFNPTKAATPTTVNHTDCTDEDNDDGTITGVATTMEYKKSTDSSWTPCTGTTITGLANGTYYVRVKATATVLASDYVTVTIAAYVEPTVTVNTKTDTVAVAPVVTAKKGEAKVEVSKNDLKDAVKAAKKEDAETIIISPDITGDVSKVNLTLPTASLEDIISDTDADLVIETAVGNLNIPSDTLAEILEEADGKEIAITIEAADIDDVEDDLPKSVNTKNAVAIEVTIKSGKEEITYFGGEALEVEVPVNSKKFTNGATYITYVISEDGSVEQTFATIVKKVAVVTMRHFSTVVITNDTANIFADVYAKDYYYEPVMWAYSNDITSGTSYGYFSPNVVCTRAQVVTFLWRAAGCPAPKGVTSGFSDVKSGSFYEKAVIWAVENGITAGTTPTTFGPEEAVTRAQVVTFLWRAEGKPVAKKASSFNDVPYTKYYAPAVDWAVENKITDGLTYYTFGPDAGCTRGQIVTFLYRNFVK